MPDAREEGLSEAIARATKGDPRFQRAWADLRETCAYAVDPRDVEGSLVRLVRRYAPTEGPIGRSFEAVLGQLPPFEPEAATAIEPSPEVVRLLVAGAQALAGGPIRRALDPWAGGGEIVAALGSGVERHANVADPWAYARAARRLGGAADGVCLAESFGLPDRSPTLTFEFLFDENLDRVARQQGLPFDLVIGDLRRAGRPDARARRRSRETFGGGGEALRWTADRLAEHGVLAFVSDEEWIDDPRRAGMRATLEREFGPIAHLALPTGLGLSFLVRGGAEGTIRYARPETVPKDWNEIEWQELIPGEGHVWRTEILRPEWKGFLALAGGRGAIFGEVTGGVAKGDDAHQPASKAARRTLRRPFAPVWRTPDRKARREPWPAEGPTLVLAEEPFGVWASGIVPDALCLGPKTRVVSFAKPSASAMRRFRTAYGAGVVERDLFDYALALLHHPLYRERYLEDLRRDVPRIPLLLPEALELLGDLPDAPEVGPGTAFRTGWTPPESFEEGTLPDYDDPFASPYARADVEPGFLLFIGLGAALYRTQVEFAKMVPRPFDFDEKGGPSVRLSRDRTRLTLGSAGSLVGVPEEATALHVGRRSALEWAVEGMRPFAASMDVDALARWFGQVVAASAEVSRLTALVETVALRF